MNFAKITLPETWSARPIRDVFTFTRKPRGLVVADDSRVPFIPMNDIPIGRVRVAASEERLGAELTSGTYIENGDLVIAKITPSFENGKQAIVELKKSFGFATTEVIPIQSVEGISDKYFLFHLLLHPEIRSELAGKMDGTTGRQRLSKEVLGGYLIPVPPVSEQRKIAAALGLVQQAIEQQEQLIALATELKNVFLKKVFSEGLHGEAQKESEIGPLPQNWDVEELGKVVAEIDYGISAPIPKTPPDGGIKIVSTADITKDGRLLYSQIRKIKAPDGTIRRLTLRTGDVLFNWRNSAELIGKTAVFAEQDEPHIFASFILRIRCDEINTHNHFIANLMNFFRGQSVFLKLARRAVNQANYNRNEISILKIPIPPFSEQCEIAASISVLDGRINFYRSRHLMLTELFHSLLHQLMTAQIRVHDLDLPEPENAAAA